MSSAICQNFVQNAWKKELCSNCFKSKDEHMDPPKPKPIQLISNTQIVGIIRNSTLKNRPKRTVNFPQTLIEIIGYGGEDWQYEFEEIEINEDTDSSSDEDFLIESDEELKRLTKENTDFNTNNLKNLELKKTQTQLLLGQPIVDSNGRKQTLLVSVTPFGEEPPSATPKRFISTLNHHPKKEKETVVLKSYTKNNEEEEEKSLLEEITETLENKNKPKLTRTPAIKKEDKPIIYQKIDTISREQAGEPDGRADPPQPIEKPQIPAKPLLIKQDSDTRNKRQAPKPPIKSLSTENLIISEEKRKKARFSLKKFLRIGPRDNEIEIPVPRPRLVIVHPTDLHEKPPPPPRNYIEKVAPPPPKNEITKKQDTVYANIGEVRSAIVPNKPQRTASMRENEKKLGGVYEAVGENIYDYVNGGRSPEMLKKGRLGKRSESSGDVSEFCRFGGQIPRSMSLTYCGSETESEIYSTYSFYGSESEVTEDDHDWLQTTRPHKLRSRKGRSIVHKNLEDNYGAVIVANHEALAQVLENIQQTSYIQPALRGLKTSANLRWSDFSIKSTSPSVKIGERIFQEAIWNTHHVTLLISFSTASSTLNLGNYSLQAISEFSDLIPDGEKFKQGTVTVLPWLQVSTISEIKTTEKDSIFLMLQLVNTLKILQAQGVEELSSNLTNFIFCKEQDKETQYKLCFLQNEDENEELSSLCMCALKALNYLLPNSQQTQLLKTLLNNERAITLTQVKSILEFLLWGPLDVALSTAIKERELALQRWLDLQRATVLHGLVCARVQLTIYEECHLVFLVRSTARMMCDASLLLESTKINNK